jgi:transcriptional regulator with XRE-family HTH domain
MNEDEYNRALGVRIREVRRNAELTQQQLADQIGVSRGSIANIELGDQAPPPYRLAVIAMVLRVQPGDLLPAIGSVSDAPGRAREVGLSDDLIALVKDVADAAGARRKDSDDGAR